MARPTPVQDNSRRNVMIVLGIGGVVVAGLILAGVLVWTRKNDAATSVPATSASAPAPLPSAAPARLEPSDLLAEARRKASAWQQDAVLVSFSASPLDEKGVRSDGAVEFVYARPAGQRISGGAEASGQRLTLRSQGSDLAQNEQRTGKGRIAPEPNCVFEDAWAAAQRAGASTAANLRMRYQWSDKHGRPVWEVLSTEGQVLRRLDGVSCSVLTR